MMREYDEQLGQKIRKKLVIVGDGGCGKTALLMVHAGLQFPETYFPTIFENFISTISLNGKIVELSLWDTAGQEDYDRLRPLSYPCSDVVLISFCVTTPETFWNVKDKWCPEINHFLPDIPRLLIGLKKDLREDPTVVENLKNRGGGKPVTPEEGAKAANEIGAKRYFECSAKTGEGVLELFTFAAKLAMKNRKRKMRSPCKML
ncbi:GTP-binding protein Rho1 [Blyttiomyces sp. JEL0837]|nr:GTP-binding protein Rho1 [Blyttiomyces sp. JEL0837]